MSFGRPLPACEGSDTWKSTIKLATKTQECFRKKHQMCSQKVTRRRPKCFQKQPQRVGWGLTSWFSRKPMFSLGKTHTLRRPGPSEIDKKSIKSHFRNRCRILCIFINFMIDFSINFDMRLSQKFDSRLGAVAIFIVFVSSFCLAFWIDCSFDFLLIFWPFFDRKSKKNETKSDEKKLRFLNRFFHRFLIEHGSQNCTFSYLREEAFGILFVTLSEGRLFNAFGPPFDSLLAPCGSLCAPFLLPFQFCPPFALVYALPRSTL